MTAAPATASPTVAVTDTPAPTETSAPVTETATPSPTNGGGQSVTIDLVAENVAFDTGTLTVPSGAEVTVSFDNRDSVPHNLAVYETVSADNPVFVGEIFSGPAQMTYTFTAPGEPGIYFFRCDVHPQQMTGDFIVE
ncbi:MAG TPA: hypothetical protein ENN85_07720 [Methanoculleus sp.]|nr:hypothetical protein [Methanoculleus sp.]